MTTDPTSYQNLPNPQVIRIISGTSHGEKIPTGTMAIRGTVSKLGYTYVLEDGYEVLDGIGGDSITEYEPLVPISYEAFKVLTRIVLGVDLDDGAMAALSVLDKEVNK